MIVKFFSRGTGGSSGVFDYLLKDKNEPDGLRRDAEILRGDVVNQSILIDSLDFKQKYTSGCLSFAESPEEVTQEQKEQLMDSFEETIRAGLDSDRIAVTWVEHRDKGRLELNFVFANVDLKHGRAFQPYVHSQDKKRINAWKDMANIEHGFKDPNDPLNKRLMAQRDNLPREVKDARQAITEGLTALVAEGVIKSRDDVIQALTDGGFEIARETDKAISIKNPNGKRNIRLTGGLYERDFKFSREVQAEVRQDSREYRQRAEQRYADAQRLYDSETARKREYHQSRHGRPKREQRGIAKAVNPAFARYTAVNRPYILTVPNPYTTKPSKRNKRDRADDRELYNTYSERDREQREPNQPSNPIRLEQVDDSRSDSFTHYIHRRGNNWGSDNEQSNRTSDLQVLSQQVRSDLYATDKGLKQHEQTATRQDRSSIDSTAGHDRATEPNARQQRQGYSSLEELIAEIDSNADRGTGTLADTTRELEEHNQRAEKSTSWLDSSTQNIARTNEQVSKQHSRTVQRSNSAHKAVRELSEYDSTRKQSIERYRAVRGQIEDYERVTTANNEQSAIAERTATAIRETVERMKLEQQQVRASKSYSPRMR